MFLNESFMRCSGIMPCELFFVAVNVGVPGGLHVYL